MIPNESAYSLLFVSGSWMIVYWRRWAETRQTHFPAFCANIGNCCSLFIIMFLKFIFEIDRKTTQLILIIHNKSTLFSWHIQFFFAFYVIKEQNVTPYLSLISIFLLSVLIRPKESVLISKHPDVRRTFLTQHQLDGKYKRTQERGTREYERRQIVLKTLRIVRHPIHICHKSNLRF